MTNKARIEQLEKQVEELHQHFNVVGTIIGEDTIVVADKPKIEKGWYKSSTNDKFLMYWDGESFIYGIDGFGTWGDEMRLCTFAKCYISATPKETESFLIKEAKRRYKKGDSIDSLHGVNGICFTNNEDYILRDENRLAIKDLGAIFLKGKWAKVIDTILKIHGEVMKVEGDIVSFGCAKFSKTQLRSIKEEITYFNDFKQIKNKESNRKIKSIILDSGKQLTIQDLKNIMKAINK